MNIEKTIEPIFEKFENELLNGSFEIKYSEKTDDSWSKNCDIIMEQLMEVKGNVYCIFIENEKKETEPVYVGQRESKDIKRRLREHLFSKSGTTFSKLDDVKKIIKSKRKIFINTVYIEPEYMRHSLEKMIIEKNSNRLIWNKHKK